MQVSLHGYRQFVSIIERARFVFVLLCGHIKMTLLSVRNCWF